MAFLASPGHRVVVEDMHTYFINAPMGGGAQQVNTSINGGGWKKHLSLCFIFFTFEMERILSSLDFWQKLLTKWKFKMIELFSNVSTEIDM